MPNAVCAVDADGLSQMQHVNNWLQCHPVLYEVAKGGEKEGGGSRPDLQV